MLIGVFTFFLFPPHKFADACLPKHEEEENKTRKRRDGGANKRRGGGSGNYHRYTNTGAGNYWLIELSRADNSIVVKQARRLSVSPTSGTTIQTSAVDNETTKELATPQSVQ